MHYLHIPGLEQGDACAMPGEPPVQPLCLPALAGPGAAVGHRSPLSLHMGQTQPREQLVAITASPLPLLGCARENCTLQ